MITCGSDVETVTEFTPLLESFRADVERVRADGETLLYDALDLARTELGEFKEAHPNSKLRVVCLTDGNDTGSDISVYDLTAGLKEQGVVVDTICIGNCLNQDLLQISKATGGYAFKPETLADALRLNELETLLSINERPRTGPLTGKTVRVTGLVQKPEQNGSIGTVGEWDEAGGRYAVAIYGGLKLLVRPVNLQVVPGFSGSAAKPNVSWDQCTATAVPPRRREPEMKGKVQTLENVLAAEESKVAWSSTVAALATGPVLPPPAAPAAVADVAAGPVDPTHTRRLLREMTQLQRRPHPAFDVFPCESNLSFWRVLCEAPLGTPYAGGVFEMFVRFPPQYPQQPPEMRFVTPILHCNVNCYGKICHSIFGRNWTADCPMHAVLEHVYGLLLTPDVADPIDTALAMQYHAGTGVYEVSVSAHTERHAMARTRAQLVAALTDDPAASPEAAQPGSGSQASVPAASASAAAAAAVSGSDMPGQRPGSASGGQGSPSAGSGGFRRSSGRRK